jgi:phosphopantothenoylcysteine decarboxylase/phosphopantothenate--cysteine ligase
LSVPRIVLGVTGSIAAYKALELVRRLRERKALVSVIMTRAAQELIRPLSFETISGNRVYTQLFSQDRPSSQDVGKMEHIDLAQTADAILVAPATANILGKAAAGIADDLLSTVIMAARAPVLFAPAMNERMWLNPIVQGNVTRLKALGYRFVEPESGALACGTQGPGRLAGVEAICAAVWELLAEGRGAKGEGRISGRTVTVTTGRTEEAIDPIRVVTNRSSGKMGFALAEAAVAAGARVRLICGRVSVPPPSGVDVAFVTTTEDMLQTLKSLLPETDILFMAAAPSDYRPKMPARHKRKEPDLTLELERTPDILAELKSQVGRRRPVMVGFALETRNLLASARAKLAPKGLDLIVANSSATLEQDEIRPTLIFRSGRMRRFPKQTKREFARVLVAEAARVFVARHGRNR